MNLTNEMETLIKETSKREGISKADVIRRAFALLQIAEKEKKQGRSLGVVSEEDNEMRVIGKIIGI